MILNSDARDYGGRQRLVAEQVHFTDYDRGRLNRPHALSLYLPNRTALVLRPEPERKSKIA
jgi:hypothetical protein